MNEKFESVRQLVFPKLDGCERRRLDKLLDRYLGFKFDFPRRVVHYDLVDDHIYVPPDQGKLCGVIDFTDAAVSDPSLDFTFLWLYGQRFVETALQHYDHAIDDDFVERSKTALQLRSALLLLEMLQGTLDDIPHSFEATRKQLNREMALF